MQGAIYQKMQHKMRPWSIGKSKPKNICRKSTRENENLKGGEAILVGFVRVGRAG